MLYFFRNIHFSTAILLVFYVIGLHFMTLAGWIPFLPGTTDAGLVYTDLFEGVLSSRFNSALLAIVLVVLQAIMLNSIADHFRLMDTRSWLPGAAFALSSALLPAFLYLSPVLVCSFFIIWSLRFLFSSYKAPKSPLHIFDVGLCVAAGSLFYPPALLLIPAFFISIGIIRSWGGRDYLVFFTGLILPLLLGWTWYFWHDRAGEFYHQYAGSLFGWPRLAKGLDFSRDWPALATVSLLFLFFLSNISNYTRSKSMLVQKSVTIMFWLLSFGAVHIFFCAEWHWERFMLVAAPAGLLLAYSYEEMKSMYAEILHMILVIAAFGLQFVYMSVA